MRLWIWMSVDILRGSRAVRMSRGGLEVAVCIFVHGRMIPGFALQLPWLLFSQVLWRRCVYQPPRRGRLRDGAAGRRAPDHPPWHGPLLETHCPVWKPQRGYPLPRHQDCEHLHQNRGPWWLEDHRYRCTLGCGGGGWDLKFSRKVWFSSITLQDNWGIVHHSGVIYDNGTKKPGNDADK